MEIEEEIRQTILDMGISDYNDSHFTDEMNDLGIPVSRQQCEEFAGKMDTKPRASST